MLKKFERIVFIFIPLTIAMESSSAAGSRDLEKDLRQICQQLLDAVAPGDVKVWDKYLSPDIIHVDENGIVQTKAELLKELTPLPPGLIGTAKIDTFKAEFHGNIAVAAYEMQESLDYHGQMLHTRFRMTDMWLKTKEGWRLIAEQTSAVLKDPPAVKLPQSMLCAYDGTYSLTPDIEVNIHCSPNGLLAQRKGRPDVEYLPETSDVFFAPGQPRSRRLFVRDAEGKVIAMYDRREGEDIKWVKKP